MKTTFCALVFVLFAVVVFASPFLVADPATSTKYRMRLSADNGVTWGAWVEGNPVNGAMKFDVAGMTNGTYLGEAQAWGDVEVTDSTSGAITSVGSWSTSSPFVLKVRGQKVVNIKVIE